MLWGNSGRSLRQDELAGACSREGWCLGEEEFKKELLAQMSGGLKAHHFGEERGGGQAEAAERIILEELAERRWAPGELRRRAKGDLEKVKIAQRLREETTMTLGWVAERLVMGSVGYLNNRLYLWRHHQLEE